VIVRCADGSLLYAPSWSRMAGLVAAAGLTEPEDARFVLDFVRPGDLFVDVGANIGFYSVLAGRRGARVKAFEPTPEACAVCRRNAVLNGIDGLLSVREAACGSASGKAQFLVGLDIENRIVPNDPSAVSVEMTTLDDEVTEPIRGLLMLKVDAEGHDLEVLAGARKLIQRFRPVVLVEVWDGGRQVGDVLSPLGYGSYKYVPRDRRLLEVRSEAQEQGNRLFICDKNFGEVRRRVTEGDRAELKMPSIRWRLRAPESSARCGCP
jgi:FkbM family methyltransferase